MSDNLAVGHEATPQTQFSNDEVGLRVLHRTTVEGKHIPHIKDTLFLIICVVNTINK